LHDLEGRVAAFVRAVPRALPGEPASALAETLEAERERWFLWVPVLFGLGIGLYFALPFEPHPVLAIAWVLAGVGLYAGMRRGTLRVVAASCLLTAALGFAAATLRTEMVRAPVIARETGVVQVTGWIERIELRAPKGNRITLRVHAIEGLEPADTPVRIRVSSRFDNLVLTVGEAVRVRAVLWPPPEPARPGAYDFARVAWFMRLGGTGFVIERPVAEPDLPDPPHALWPVTIAESLRDYVGHNIRAALPGEEGTLAEALVTGERGRIPDASNDALRDSGLSHILAISGFNMAIMAGAMLGFLRAVLALFPGLALNYPIRKWAAVGGLAGATFCLVLSGAGPATTRAFVMIALMLVATLFERPALSMRNLAIAALVLLVWAPETLLDVSFQMSFAAVVALMAVYEAIRERSERATTHWSMRYVAGRALWFIGGTLGSTAVASLAVAPLAAFHFHKLAQYGLVANVLAVPLFTFLIMPLVVVMLVLMPFGLAWLALWPMEFCLKWLMAVAVWVSELEGAVWRMTAMPASAVTLMMLGAVWLALWRRRWRMLGLVVIAAGMLQALSGTPPDILVAREGRPTAIRLADGTLSALPVTGDSFEVAEWLESDGDGRSVEAAAQGKGYRCDADGCTAIVKGRTIAWPNGPAALREDCRRAQVVIMRMPLSRPCPSAELVIDVSDLEAYGAHAITFEGNRYRIVSIAAYRGMRPWVRRPVRSNEAGLRP
jgi:competence protein ComEC